MEQIKFGIQSENKDMFYSKFSKLFATEIANFSDYGKQPLMTWYDDENNIGINAVFIDKLPEIAKTELQQLIQGLQ